MDAIAIDTLTRVLRNLLAEVYEGAAGPMTWTWILDPEPGSGVLGTLDRLTAAEASRPIVEGGTTIAAHAEHLRWSLAFANAFFRGEQPEPDWPASWALRAVDEPGWERLREGLREEFETLRRAIDGHRDWSNELFLTGTIAAVAHSSYHLGAIRQLAKAVRDGGVA